MINVRIKNVKNNNFLYRFDTDRKYRQKRPKKAHHYTSIHDVMETSQHGNGSKKGLKKLI